jgi:propionate catabolism operon transcriptional regulator
VLAQLRDGVVAVDTNERIETLNPAMERLLGVSREELLGRRLGDVAPELSLRRTLRDARAEVEQIERLGDRTIVVSRIPIVEQGMHTGAVLTCQDPASIQRVDRHLRTERRVRVASARYGLDQIVGTGAALMRAKALAANFARSDATVLIRGESGTGKELLAQWIHRASRRASQPFIALNCAAFPESLLESELFGYEEGAFTGSRRGGKAGLFEAAHTGTIFLDEIGEMPPPLQTRLLRVLQEREVLRIGATEATPIDVRVVAATHRDLQADIEAGTFRRDLYFRLNILRVEMPPLRGRREDVPELAQHLLRKIVGPKADLAERLKSLVAELVEQTRHYAWPGNVRELENLLERAVVHCDEAAAGDGARARLQDIAPELFQPEGSGAGDALKRHRERVDADHIVEVLAACQGDRAMACRRLGIGRTTLWRKLKEAGLSGSADSRTVAHL